MAWFMPGRKILVPPGYAERSCLLVGYHMPFLRHCFVLCHEPKPDFPEIGSAELMAFFLSEARRLAYQAAGDEQAFMLIRSGASIRRRPNRHFHVFVVRNRWQKAWVYLILGMKNAALALYEALMASVRKKD